jgi:hypothetical protein
MTCLALPTIRTMRLKTLARLLLVSVVLSAGSPAFAKPIAHHGVDYHRTLGPRTSPGINAPHWNNSDETRDDWPANMILG